MEPLAPEDPETSPRRLVVEASGFHSRDSIESYLERLNRHSPVARRDITHWGPGTRPHLRVGAVPLTSIGAPTGEVFLGEAQTSFGLDVRAAHAAASSAPYSVGLVLAGTLSVTLAGGAYDVHAGEGVIVDPAEVERTRFGAGAHFVEFALPRHMLLRLGAELAPGELSGSPRFAPVLQRPMARKLLSLAAHAAEVLHDDGPARGKRVLFERWLEMIALTLLHECTTQHDAASREGLAPATPRSLSRALDFIDAHAQDDVLLADIAAAACISASALLRQFNDHLGQTPVAFLRQVRLDRARGELLRGSGGTIRELAERWGFRSAARFNQAYQRRFGERPTASRAAR